MILSFVLSLRWDVLFPRQFMGLSTTCKTIMRLLCVMVCSIHIYTTVPVMQLMQHHPHISAPETAVQSVS